MKYYQNNYTYKKRQNSRFLFCILVAEVEMKVYVDLIFFINFMFDLLLLLSVGIERKIYAKFYRFVIGALIGSSSMISMMFSMNGLVLFLFKLILSIAMVVVTFSYRNRSFFLENLKCLYGSSIILGGLMYFLNIQASYYQDGLIFVHDGTSINLIIIMIASPIIFYLYIKKKRRQNLIRSLLHTVKFHYKNEEFIVQGYLDTGNAVVDPYKKRKVIILSNANFYPCIEESILVSYKTVGHQGILRCIVADQLFIDDKIINVDKCLIGTSEENINIKGANCILPEGLLEEE